MKTSTEYKKSLKKMRANIYKFGELIKDVTTHPATKRTVEGHAQIFDAAQKKEYQEILTTKSGLTGERIIRYLSIIKNADDMIANVKMKRLMFNLTGTCTGGRCAGFNAINAMWSTTYDMDEKHGSNYHERLKKWLKNAQRDDITLAGALTDPKGDRTKRPSEQKDPDMNLHLVEKREDGIVVKGAKVMICGVAAANEVFVMPGASYKESDKNYAISFAIPRDVENLTIVETRRPSDLRELEKGFDNPVTAGGITQAYLLFENVFVPWERVFMCGEFNYTTEAVMNFIAPYRAAIGGCVAGQGDVMIGAAALMARANGLNEKIFKDKIIKMIINNETTFGMGLAAAVSGKKHPSGAWIPDALLSNVNKVHVATLPYDTSLLAQDIAGGLMVTLPSERDLRSPETGKWIDKYLKANPDVSTENRMRILRLIENITLGTAAVGYLTESMHGAGSPQAQRIMISRRVNLPEKQRAAKRLCGIRE